MDLKIKILSKSQLFVWKCLRNSIGVKSCLAARGLNIDPLCPQCGVETETIIHALRDCEPVKSILRHLGVDRNVDNSLQGTPLFGFPGMLSHMGESLEPHLSFCYLGHLAEEKLEEFSKTNLFLRISTVRSIIE